MNFAGDDSGNETNKRGYSGIVAEVAVGAVGFAVDGGGFAVGGVGFAVDGIGFAVVAAGVVLIGAAFFVVLPTLAFGVLGGLLFIDLPVGATVTCPGNLSIPTGLEPDSIPLQNASPRPLPAAIRSTKETATSGLMGKAHPRWKRARTPPSRLIS